MDYLGKYLEWLNSPCVDENIKNELLDIKDDEKEIEDRFYKNLKFGTGGLRGILGAGTNRMNVITVGMVTQGLAQYILAQNGQKQGVVIAYDSRHMSKEFAIRSALCLCANGIKTYLFDNLRPTPELSFAVRYLKAKAGIVITASHNPAKYNGYKVYYEDGAQITPPHDKNILDEVAKIQSLSDVLLIDKETAQKKDLLEFVGKDIDDAYINELKKQIINIEVIKKVSKDIKIVYTPLHGTGNILVRRVLDELGFKNVYIVKEQELPDEDFPTVDYPNPEDKNAFKLALKLAKSVDADIVLATDPDADRLGIYSKDNNGEYVSFTGNMLGILLAEYILCESQKKGILPSNAAVVKTIVTTNMADKVANEYGVKLIEVLTGFKYIGEQIKLFKKNNTYEYMFGFEESYGCLKGTYARDKDAVVAVMLLCEVCAYQKYIGKTIYDRMNELYKKYGYYMEDLFSITLTGIDSSKKIDGIMQKLRESNLEKIGDFKVVKIRDYKNNIISDVRTNESTEINLPISNVYYYELEDNAWCCIRPSGTELKIKIYIGVYDICKEQAIVKLTKLKDEIKKFLNNI